MVSFIALLSYIITTFFNYVLYYCPMAMNVVSVQYNDGSLPDIILLTQGYYYHWGTLLNAMKRLYF